MRFQGDALTPPSAIPASLRRVAHDGWLPIPGLGSVGPERHAAPDWHSQPGDLVAGFAIRISDRPIATQQLTPSGSGCGRDSQLTGNLIHRQFQNRIRQSRCQTCHGCGSAIQQFERPEIR